MALDLREAAVISLGEIRTLLRDRHTLVYSILLPMLLYPVLFLGGAQAVTIARGASERRISRVAVPGGERLKGLTDHLAATERLQVVPLGEGPAAGDDTDLRSRIRQWEFDAAVIPSEGPGGSLRFEILYSQASDASSGARKRLETALEEYRTKLLQQTAAALGEGEAFLDVQEVQMADIAPVQRRLQEVMARIVPLLLVIMTAFGCFYPALDVTVGERERSTLETTLLMPVGRTSLVLGKFIPVACLGLLSVILNFTGMALAIWTFLLQFKVDLRPEAPSLGSLAAVSASMVLLALLLGAVMMAVSLFARSFKEGQSYLGTILLAAMIPGILATVPEVPLNAGMALVPVANLALAVRDAFLGKLTAGPCALTFVASAVYAALVILAAGRLAGREAVLLGTTAFRDQRRGPLAWILGR